MIHIPDIVKTKCGKCGAIISPGYDFCLSCGTKFSEIPPKIEERDQWKFLYRIFGIVGLIIFVMIVLIIYIPAFFTGLTK